MSAPWVLPLNLLVAITDFILWEGHLEVLTYPDICILGVHRQIDGHSYSHNCHWSPFADGIFQYFSSFMLCHCVRSPQSLSTAWVLRSRACCSWHDTKLQQLMPRHPNLKISENPWKWHSFLRKLMTTCSKWCLDVVSKDFGFAEVFLLKQLFFHGAIWYSGGIGGFSGSSCAFYA